ncbi:hypothetical protein [Photobacterium leiognathi]|uniref:hypothetical protein n=1 Tax=Photobacterium leiognathi TaxID=553611 RepID=UPI002982958B|nr:hypothetical protein [Photobacterium leiognathi]
MMIAKIKREQQLRASLTPTSNAFDRGARDFHRAKNLSSNPYKIPSRKGEDWHKGWMKAKNNAVAQSSAIGGGVITFVKHLIAIIF